MASLGSTCLGTELSLCFYLTYWSFICEVKHVFEIVVCVFVSMHTCTGGKTTPVCQTGWYMKGSRKNPWSIQVGALHRAACCTASMNFLESNMKEKVVRWLIFLPLIDYKCAREEWGNSLTWYPYVGAFLTRMRDYMLPAHKQLIQDISLQPSLKRFVQQQSSERLNQAFQLCVTRLLALRSYHINIVSRFITVPAARARQLRNQSQEPEPELISRAPAALEERGTGGSGIMSFLKTVRDQTKDALLPEASKEMKPHNWCRLSHCTLLYMSLKGCEWEASIACLTCSFVASVNKPQLNRHEWYPSFSPNQNSNHYFHSVIIIINSFFNLNRNAKNSSDMCSRPTYLQDIWTLDSSSHY